MSLVFRVCIGPLFRSRRATTPRVPGLSRPLGALDRYTSYVRCMLVYPMGGARFCILPKNTSTVGQWSPLGHLPCSNDVVRVAFGRRLRLASHRYSSPSPVNTSGRRRHRRRASLWCQASHPQQDNSRARRVFFLVRPFTAGLVRGSLSGFPRLRALHTQQNDLLDHPRYPKAASKAKCDGTNRVAR